MKNDNRRLRVRVRFSLFYSELAPTDSWCNMLQILLGLKIYEEEMSDEQYLDFDCYCFKCLPHTWIAIPLFFSMGIMWSRDFHGCIYQLKSYWMKMRLLNENKNFEWNYKNYWKTKLLNRYWSHWVKQNKGNMKTVTQKIATRMIPTAQFSPGKLSLKKIPTQDNPHPENSHPG